MKLDTNYKKKNENTHTHTNTRILNSILVKQQQQKHVGRCRNQRRNQKITRDKENKNTVSKIYGTEQK